MKTMLTITTTILIALAALGQKKPVPIYKTLLKEELKNATIYQTPIKADFNGDDKIDYALILQKNDHRKTLWLYVVYSRDTTYQKQNLGQLNDRLDLELATSPKGEQGLSSKPTPHPFTGLLVRCNGYNDLFEYDPAAHKFILDAHEDIGP